MFKTSYWSEKVQKRPPCQLFAIIKTMDFLQMWVKGLRFYKKYKRMGGLLFYTYDWHPQYNEGHLKSVFILARNVQHIILKSKSTKAPLMSILYNHRNHEVSSNVSQRFTFLWEIQKYGGALSFYTYEWRSQYIYSHAFIAAAKNVQHIILKWKSIKVPLMSVLYDHRNHGVSSNLSQRLTFP